jgi:Tol biopolymer transport system component/predicted Ser/Thr protein kinase
MSLATGTRLGPYEIVAPLGAGGMGEVYKATDTRLDRVVAIKVLSGHLAGDPDLRERFDREARAISALNHPNICALYDVGHQNDVDFLVMEYLDGEVLSERLKKGALPVADVLRYGIEIASALDRAHRAGIIHRDLKPGNIVISKGGAKLLDFGLAKRQAAASAPGVTALATTPPELTARGSILGTFQYMAPEQLEGADADARSDIFAFGAVLYEMATGRKAFEGKTQASLIAGILEREPPALTTLQPAAPSALERIIRVALAKDPDDRWQTARDVMRELKELAPASVPVSVVSAPAVVRQPRSRERLAWGVAGLAVLVAAAALWRAAQPNADAGAPTRFLLAPPPKTDFVSNTILTVSPNGRHLVFMAGDNGSADAARLYLRAMDATDSVPLAGTENAGVPFWSPDSRFIGFFADGKLKKIPLTGGPPQVLCDAAVQGNNRGGAAWGLNDVIVFQPGNVGPLFRVSASGGTPVQATKLDETRKEATHRYPSFLPDGKHFVYVAQPGGWLVVGALDSDEHKILIQADSKPVFVAPDHLLYVRQATLLAQRFDPKRFELSGDAIPVGQSVRANATFGSGAFSASENGVLVYGTGTATVFSRLAWFDHSGSSGAVAVDALVDYRGLALSPDGRRVVAHRHEGVSGGGLWITDLERSATSRFTLTAAHETDAVWSPDGSKIAFASAADAQPAAMYVKLANGTGAAEQLLKGPADIRPMDWSSDGKSIAYVTADPKTQDDVYVLPLAGDRTPRAIARTAFTEGGAQFSPDGRYIAYHSNESRRYEIYVQSLAPGGGRWQISSGTGIFPRWRHDGNELYYVSTSDFSWMAVPMNMAGESPVAGVPKMLFKPKAAVSAAGFPYAPAADGKRFLIANELDQPGSALTVVLNWTASLTKR